MGLMYSNPTRRKGPRTGGIPVPKALVEKILHKIFSSPQVKHTVEIPRLRPGASKEEKTLAAILDTRPVPAVTFLPMTIPGTPVELWHFTDRFTLKNYVTGKNEELRVTVRDLERDKGSAYSGGVAGWQESSSDDVVELPKAKRRERAARALKLLGVEPTPAMIKKIFAADEAFAMYGSPPIGHRTIEVSLAVDFMRPMRKTEIETEFRNTLVHEIAHGLDEGLNAKHVRRMREREAMYEAIDAAAEADSVAFLLGLPAPPSAEDPFDDESPRPRLSRKKKHFTPTQAYYELPHETTARIAEIFAQIDRNLASFKGTLRWTTSNRSDSLIRALRYASSTFRKMERRWDRLSLQRVLRAVYDRYHREKWFPKPTGVLKNRRTSRRRTSRR